MTSSHPISQSLFNRACAVIPGGVNSPVRAFRAVGGEPLFIKNAHGAYIFDEDGRRYIDYVQSWGPMILGHRSEVILQAIAEALERGSSFGAPTDLEVELAELITELVPAVEMVRMVNSGTEATMSVIRLARAFTKRDYLIKFNGCYHGHSDSLLVAAGSGVTTCGIAGSAGVPQAIAALTVSIEFNDQELLERTFMALGPEKIAAVILEPIPGNMGLVLPRDGFLKAVGELCSKYGVLLIFDEVMTGFRVSLGGAAERFGITPDLCTFGKIIGGGLPVGAFGGRKEIMKYLAPLGPAYQAGTLSGNPLAMAAGLAALRQLQKTNPYPLLGERANRWRMGMQEIGIESGVEITASHCGSMLGFFFWPKGHSPGVSGPINYSKVLQADISFFQKFFQGMLVEGIYLAPSAFEAGFMGVCHTEEIIDETIDAARRVVNRLRILV